MSTSSTKGVQTLLNERLSTSTLGISAFNQLCVSLDTPLALGAFLRIKYNELDDYFAHSYPPEYFQTWYEFADYRQVFSFLKKYPFPGRQEICEQKARETFLSCEDRCRTFNQSLRAEWENPLSPVAVLIMSARWKIARLLGQFDAEEWLSCCRFGPGSNIGVLGTSDMAKLTGPLTLSDDLYPYAGSLLRSFPAWCRAQSYRDDQRLNWTVVPGGRYSQVPKDARTNRNIEIQPMLNTFTQLGIGAMIRSRLKTVKIDLDDQSRNQEAARIGSISGDLATLDLSNASDTIATELVRLLLPSDWLHAMEISRTKSIKFGDEYRPLERFCSMGNGFAFELESLIFWAISKSACETVLDHAFPLLVYGDDIIVPTVCYESVRSALESVGFSVNPRKSYHSGVFRESCGADYWQGINVRPHFLKEVPQNVASLISLANGLRRAAHRRNRNLGYDRRFAACWYHVIRRIPPKIRRKIAFGYTETDDIVLSGRDRDGFRIQFVQRKFTELNWFPAVAAALYRVQQRHGFGDVDTPTVLDSGRGQLFDYRRDCGKWALRKHQRLLATDATMIWW
jgi:hypothetical protein